MYSLNNIKIKTMSKNNYNKKTPWTTIIIVTIAVLGLGYFLVTSSPKSTGQTATGDGMHGSPGAPNTAQLNSLVDKTMPAIQLTDKDGKTYASTQSCSLTKVLCAIRHAGIRWLHLAAIRDLIAIRFRPYQ
jgi:hypothetical protein